MMDQTYHRKPGKFEKRNPILDRVGEDNIICREFRDIQIRALKEVGDSSFSLVKAPCGSGKSTAQIALAMRDYLQDNLRKQLFVVPMTNIGRGFSEVIKYRLPNGEIWKWDIPPYYLLWEDRTSKVGSLKDFLRDDLPPCKDNAIECGCVTTHSLLALAWDSFSDEQRKKAITNLTLRIDECQRVRSGDAQNRIGQICDFVFLHPELGAKICLSTATFWRADRTWIVDPKVFNARFSICFMSWREYWSDYTGIDTIKFAYHNYQGDPVNAVMENIAKHKGCCQLIIVPQRNSKYRKGDFDLTSAYMGRLSNLYKAEEILNLVDFGERNVFTEQGKEAAEQRKKLRVVIACRKFDLGVDWESCDVIHNTDCESSSNLAVQRIGRGMRKSPNKNSLSVHYYMMSDLSAMMDTCRDHTNVMCVAMQFEDLLGDTLILPSINGNFGGDPPALQDIFGDEWDGISETLSNYRQKNEPVEKIFEYIESVVDLIPEEHKESKDQIVEQLKRVALRVCGGVKREIIVAQKSAMDLEEFLRMWKEHGEEIPFDWRNGHPSASLTPEVLKRFEDVFGIYKWEDGRRLAQAAIKAAGGVSKIHPSLNVEPKVFYWLRKAKADYQSKRLDDTKMKILAAMEIEKFVDYCWCVKCYKEIKAGVGDVCDECRINEGKESKRSDAEVILSKSERKWVSCRLKPYTDFRKFDYEFIQNKVDDYESTCALYECVKKLLVRVIFMRRQPARSLFVGWKMEQMNARSDIVNRVSALANTTGLKPFLEGTEFKHSAGFISSEIREGGTDKVKDTLGFVCSLEQFLHKRDVTIVVQKGEAGGFTHLFGVKRDNVLKEKAKESF